LEIDISGCSTCPSPSASKGEKPHQHRTHEEAAIRKDFVSIGGSDGGNSQAQREKKTVSRSGILSAGSATQGEDETVWTCELEASGP
jgi:hypothetical protein